ncbi:winged helix-turn-helix domain-containing protein [Streptomyces albireticuli]|nr:winged helix-turn-helix domain-containing protein [Streptomyces albireticuli]MCD9142388.1 winged helix-turn-helix domain-containing protein [Streptomyces albireticuli]MCD9166033.1 winged helix-turn-helix domain-containing protein [Streptomyces albireticuli]MCD9192516.1 winged helix-turn-helix domain-containing protein [Streptomyces albireticuli]
MVEWTGKPAYQQVAEDLRRRIAAEEFKESGRLPSLAELQESYKVTITVARDAIRALKSDGLAVSHQGKGAFLTSDSATLARQNDPQAAVEELRQEIKQLKHEVGRLRERLEELET